MIGTKKKPEELGLICQRCGSQSVNLKEYVLHKKHIHNVRVVDSINSLTQLGMEDKSFEALLAEFPNEKYHPEYIKESRKMLKSYMEKFNKY